MKEWGTLPKELKIFLYLWERVHDCLKPKKPNQPNDNKANHKLASMVSDIMSHDTGITLVTIPPCP